MNKLTDFAKGLLAGVVASVIIFLVIMGFRFLVQRDKKIHKAWEKQHEVQMLQEEYRNRDPYEFLDDIPGVRRAADNAIDEFRRKRDEAVQRFRDRPLD